MSKASQELRILSAYLLLVDFLVVGVFDGVVVGLAGVGIPTSDVTGHATELDCGTALIPAGNAAQIGIVARVMAACHVSTHPAVLYRAVVVARNAAHHSCIAYINYSG